MEWMLGRWQQVELVKNGALRAGLGLSLVVFVSAVLRIMGQDYPNFSPIAAAALFMAWQMQSMAKSWLVAFAALALSNFWLAPYQSGMVALSVYLCYMVPALLNRWAAGRWERLPFAVLAGSVIFFLGTNFAVWAFEPWYTKDWSGLMTCFANAIPFFRYTLAADIFYTVFFFGGYAVWQMVSRKAAYVTSAA